MNSIKPLYPTVPRKGCATKGRDVSNFQISDHLSKEIDLELCLGNFEFSVVPKALFTADEKPLPCMDKAKLLHQIEESVKKNNETNIPDNIQLHQQHKVLITNVNTG